MPENEENAKATCAPFFKKLMNKAARKSAATVILTIVSLLSLLTAVTFSWFNNSRLALTTAANIDVYRPPTVYIGTIRDDRLEWNSRLDLTAEKTLRPVCGNGTSFFTRTFSNQNGSASQFITSTLNNKLADFEGYSTYSQSVTSYQAMTQQELLSFVEIVDFSLQTTVYGAAYISDVSEMTPALSESPESYYIPGLSTGYIAGALRVGIAQKEEDQQYHLRCVWIPNAHYEYNLSANTFTENGTIEEKYTFINTAAGAKTEIATEDYPGGYAVIGDILYVWDLAACDHPFCQIASDGDCEFRMFIWLEGTDRECENALAGGHVNVTLGIHIPGGEE